MQCNATAMVKVWLRASSHHCVQWFLWYSVDNFSTCLVTVLATTAADVCIPVNCFKIFTCILLVTVLCTDDSWRVTSQHNGGRPTDCSYCVVCVREFGAVWNVQLLHPSLSFSLSSPSSQLGEASLPFGHPSMTASWLWSEGTWHRTCGEGSRVF